MAANFNRLKEENEKQTKLVYFYFFLLYLFIGLIIDTAGYLNCYTSECILNTLKSLVTFQLIPYFTITLFISAFLSIIFVHLFHKFFILNKEDYYEITSEEQNPELKQVYNIVEELKIAARLKKMPKVYVINANYMNAFASGWNEENALVAVTTELLKKLNREELEAVLAHEIGHIKNRDIKLNLSIISANAIVLFILDFLMKFLIYGDDSSKRKNNDRTLNIVFFFAVFISYYLFLILSKLLEYKFSRIREFYADARSVEFTRNPEGLAKALRKISQDYSESPNKFKEMDQKKAHFYIFNKVNNLFATHPPIEERIKKILGKKEI